MPNSSSKFLLSNTVHATYRLNIITTTFTYVQPNAHKTQLQFPQPNYQQKNPPSKKERTSYSLTLTRRHRRKVRSCFSRQRSPHRLLSYPGHTSNECEIKKAEKKKKKRPLPSLKKGFLSSQYSMLLLPPLLPLPPLHSKRSLSSN